MPDTLTAYSFHTDTAFSAYENRANYPQEVLL